VLGLLLVVGTLLLMGCGSTDETPSTNQTPSSLAIEATKFLFRDDISSTEPTGVFLELHYLLSNQSDSEMIFAHDDLQLESTSGRSYPHSPVGLAAWINESPGYNLTETIGLTKGSHPRPWVTVFDIPMSERGSNFEIRFQNEPAVSIPEGLERDDS
jgi:hypothetical protein